MLWLLFLPLPCLGGSVTPTPGPSPGHELVGIIGGCDVSQEWVLTAAHCIRPDNLLPRDLRVQVGQMKLYDHDQLTEVTLIIQHPKFVSSQGGADIALLRLKAPVTLSHHINVVSLPPASLRVPKGKMCWVTGWGDITYNCRHVEPRLWPMEPCVLEMDGHLDVQRSCGQIRAVEDVGKLMSLPLPYHLQEVEVPIVGHKVCNKHYQTFEDGNNPIKDDMLCAGSKGRDSCQYDSGGPQVCSWNCAWVQVGVMSWGYKCGLHNFPGVYTQAMSYVPWIRQYVPLSPRA
ncbi:Mastin [Camelus dromedarius]|uniref:Mastin n=1 Tax=Camelus dromedarius TaxID=9838 RepID=A0A5N4BYV0_CAMDR|nr:Mastin [Camelus dromedarius]